MANTLSATEFNKIADQISQIYSCVRGYPTAANVGYGVGEDGSAPLPFGAVYAIDQMKAALVADFDDCDALNIFLAPVLQLERSASASAIGANLLSPMISSIESAIALFAITNVQNLEQFMSYYNVGTGVPGTYWSHLQHPAFRALMVALNKTPQIENYYFECKRNGVFYPNLTFTDALGRFSTGGGFVAGYDVAALGIYAGGLPRIEVVTWAGAADVVTVTGTAFDPVAKAFSAGKTWTVNVGATGTFTLVPGGATPAPADSLLAKATAVAAGVLITNIDLYVESHKGAGRVNVF